MHSLTAMVGYRIITTNRKIAGPGKLRKITHLYNYNPFRFLVCLTYASEAVWLCVFLFITLKGLFKTMNLFNNFALIISSAFKFYFI